MRNARASVAACLAAAVALVACTPAGPDSGTFRTQRPSASSAPTGPTRTAAEGAEPLVLVVHATRPAPRISSREARAIIDGRVRTWRPLDGSRAPLRLLRADDPDSRLRPFGVMRRVVRDPRAVGVVRGWDVTPMVRAVVVDGVDPLRRPSAYPLRASGAPAGPVVTLTAVGEMMLGRGVATAWDGEPARSLAPLAGLLRRSSVTVGTLGTTLSQAGAPQQGADSLSAPRSVVTRLADAGFDAVSLAGDHTGDFGSLALRETVGAFRGRRVGAFGAGASRRIARRPVRVTREGVRFAFVGFNAVGGTPLATMSGTGALTVRMPPATGPLNEADLGVVERLVTRLDAEVDVVVVMPHWGPPLGHTADPAQRAVARRLSAAGADLIIGSHPQWVQGIERVGRTVVAHSLGGFVDDVNPTPESGQGVVFTAVLWDGEMKAVELTPYVLGPGFAPRRARGAAGAAILGDVWSNAYGAFATP